MPERVNVRAFFLAHEYQAWDICVYLCRMALRLSDLLCLFFAIGDDGGGIFLF